MNIDQSVPQSGISSLRENLSEYEAECKRVGIQPEPARRKQFPKVVRIPGANPDRGRRVGSPQIKELFICDVVRDAVAFAEHEKPLSESSLITPRVIWFLLNVRNARQMQHRAASLLLEAGLTLRDLQGIWGSKAITRSPLKVAQGDLARLRLREKEDVK